MSTATFAGNCPPTFNLAAFEEVPPLNLNVYAAESQLGRVGILLTVQDTMAPSGATYNSLLESDFHARHEEQKSFDPVASVRMFRHDIERYGRVLPETRRQVHDEELSLIAEAVDRASYTTFVLKRQGDDLTYFKDGKWSSYTGMLITGKAVADREALEDPRRQFLAEDAGNDLTRVYQMRKLRPGEQMVWCSPYRKDVEEATSVAFMKECGRFPERQMGFIHRAYCNADGDIILESQTVDGSTNGRAIAAVMARGSGHIPIAMLDLVAEYDQVMHEDDPAANRYFAGRLGAKMQENAYSDMQTHQDLIEFFLDRIEAIARMPIGGKALEREARMHMYGVWAAFKNRLDGVTVSNYRALTGGIATAHTMLVSQEVNQALFDFAAAGKAMIGCGGSIEILRGLENVLNTDGKAVFDAIFGKTKDGSNGDCEYVSKACPMCGTKNVKTVDRRFGSSGKRRITGSCGCSKIY